MDVSLWINWQLEMFRVENQMKVELLICSMDRKTGVDNMLKLLGVSS